MQVEFDNDARPKQKIDHPSGREDGGMVGILIRTGIVSTKGQARAVLAIVAVVVLAIASFIFLRGQRATKAPGQDFYLHG